MTERKWTEGPWNFDELNVGKSFCWCWQIRTEYGGTPVYVECASRRGGEIRGNEATAHLIAAAPCLYEALETAVELLESHRLLSLAPDAESALAKARGGS